MVVYIPAWVRGTSKGGAPSFVSVDHLVGASEKLRWNIEVKVLRTLEIDDEQPFGWLLKGQVPGLSP